MVETKKTEKKKRGPRDYGKLIDVKAPVGFKEAEDNSAFAFSKFGDTIKGIFEGYEMVGKGKKQRKMILLKNQSGQIQKIFSSFHLLKLMEQANIKKGTEIVAQFIELIELSGGRTMKKFKLFYK